MCTILSDTKASVQVLAALFGEFTWDSRGPPTAASSPRLQQLHMDVQHLLTVMSSKPEQLPTNVDFLRSKQNTVTSQFLSFVAQLTDTQIALVLSSDSVADAARAVKHGPINEPQFACDYPGCAYDADQLKNRPTRVGNTNSNIHCAVLFSMSNAHVVMFNLLHLSLPRTIFKLFVDHDAIQQFCLVFASGSNNI